MKRDELLAEIDRAFGGIQHLQVAPTEHNVAILFDCMNVLKTAYNYVKEMPEHAADSNDRGN